MLPNLPSPASAVLKHTSADWTPALFLTSCLLQGYRSTAFVVLLLIATRGERLNAVSGMHRLSVVQRSSAQWHGVGALGCHPES
jgi:hypothetical protein